MSAPPRAPVTLLTGFLGSGKTTLFSRLLLAPGVGRIAAIVNEFGDIDLDHDLLEASSEDIVTLGNGCLCCAMRGNLAETLRNLVGQRDRHPRFAFDRVVIETSGLVDPVPVLRLLLGDPWIAGHFDVAGVVTLVDAANGERTLERHPEAVSQVQVADLLVITKTDLVEPGSVSALDRRLGLLNPAARRLRAVNGEVDALVILALEPALPASGESPGGGSPAEGSQAEESPAGWRAAAAGNPVAKGQHSVDVRSMSFRFDRPLTPSQFDRLLAILRSLAGPGLLRAKGIVSVQGQPAALAVHAVQDVLHPTQPLASVASGLESRLVVIGRHLDEGGLEALSVLSRGDRA